MKEFLSYRWHLGTWAWLLHRLSGLALTGYLVLHIMVIHSIGRGPGTFDRMMEAVQQPLFRFLEVGLWGVILYHTFNGLRILMVDLGWGAARQKALWLAAMSAAGLFFVLGGVPMLIHAMR